MVVSTVMCRISAPSTLTPSHREQKLLRLKGAFHQVSENMKKIRVLIAKPGLDGHDRGAKVIARALRDAGMEVIYTGLKQTPEMIVADAIEEDVDVIGLSILSGAHIPIIEKLTELLESEGAADITIILGGIIPQDDIPILKDMGVAGVFGPGTVTGDIIAFIQESQSNR